jgi:hypothetical protein
MMSRFIFQNLIIYFNTIRVIAYNRIPLVNYFSEIFFIYYKIAHAF